MDVEAWIQKHGGGSEGTEVGRWKHEDGSIEMRAWRQECGQIFFDNFLLLISFKNSGLHECHFLQMN